MWYSYTTGNSTCCWVSSFSVCRRKCFVCAASQNRWILHNSVTHPQIPHAHFESISQLSRSCCWHILCIPRLVGYQLGMIWIVCLCVWVCWEHIRRERLKLLSELITKPASNNPTEKALHGYSQLAGQFVTASKLPPAAVIRGVCVRMHGPVCACLSAGWQKSLFVCACLMRACECCSTVVSHKNFDSKEIKKNACAYCRSNENSVDTFRWRFGNIFPWQQWRQACRDKLTLRLFCSVTLLCCSSLTTSRSCQSAHFKSSF